MCKEKADRASKNGAQRHAPDSKQKERNEEQPSWRAQQPSGLESRSNDEQREHRVSHHTRSVSMG